MVLQVPTSSSPLYVAQSRLLAGLVFPPHPHAVLACLPRCPAFPPVEEMTFLHLAQPVAHFSCHLVLLGVLATVDFR